MLIKLFCFLLSFVILIISIIIGLLMTTDETFYTKELLHVSDQNRVNLSESSSSSDILNSEGKLNYIGWSTSPNVFNFNPVSINPTNSLVQIKNIQNLRYKKWDAYVFYYKNLIFSFAAFDLSYLGGTLFHIANLEDDSTPISYEYLHPINKPVIMDTCHEHCTSSVFPKGNSLFEANFSKMSLGNQYVKYEINIPNMKFKVDVKLNQNKDSIVTFNPIIEDSSLFYYNSKTNTMKVNGNIEVNGSKYSSSDFLATYDLGRGAWPVKSGWIWVNGNGYIGGNTDNTENTNKTTFGINIGHGFTHKTAGFTEDCFFIDGQLHKLSSIVTEQDTNTNKHGYKNYTFKSFDSSASSNASTCNLRFTTIKRGEKVVNLIFARVTFNANYGRMNGKCYDSKGKEYIVNDVPSLIEEKMSLW